MTQLSFNVSNIGGRVEASAPLMIEVNRLTIAGWAGRDRAAIEHHASVRNC
jgi:hypothetical protein